jgi:hypothetical protein
VSRSTPSSTHARRTDHLRPYQWRPGASGNPKGRPGGKLDKLHRLQIEAAERGSFTPLDILLAIARRDEPELLKMGLNPRECSLAIRKSAAEAALPYTARRLPIAIDAAVTEKTADTMVDLSQLTDEELRQLDAIHVRLGLIPPDDDPLLTVGHNPMLGSLK